MGPNLVFRVRFADHVRYIEFKNVRGPLRFADPPSASSSNFGFKRPNFGFRQTDGQTDGQIDGQTDGQTDRRTDRQTDGQTDRRTDGQTDGQTDAKNIFWAFLVKN